MKGINKTNQWSIGAWMRLFCQMACLLSLCLPYQNAFSCTDFRLKAGDNSILITRSMEFSVDLNSNIRTSVRGKFFSFKTPDGKNTYSWKSKYGYIYTDAFNTIFALDGMNEKGLSFEYLYLPGETQYQSIPNGENTNAIPYLAFGDWVLSNFATIDEVKSALNNIYVYAMTVPELGEMVFPLHAAIFDAEGKGLVIEFIGGEMYAYENEVGVLTNSPTFDWQVVNLRNYVNLSPYVPNPVTVDGKVFLATGQGAGMKGLPGDVSPPSRFVKTAILLTTASPTQNSAEALNLAQHIINNVDIPKGTVRSLENGKETTEYTQWVVFKNLTLKRLSYRTYDDMTLRTIDATKVDLSENGPQLKMPMTAGPLAADITDFFLTQLVKP